MSVRIHGRPINMTIVQVYAHTSTAEDDEHEEFYGKLQDSFDNIPKEDIPIVMGDLNAKVGQGAGKHELNLK